MNDDLADWITHWVSETAQETARPQKRRRDNRVNCLDSSSDEMQTPSNKRTRRLIDDDATPRPAMTSRTATPSGSNTEGSNISNTSVKKRKRVLERSGVEFEKLSSPDVPAKIKQLIADMRRAFYEIDSAIRAKSETSSHHTTEQLQKIFSPQTLPSEIELRKIMRKAEQRKSMGFDEAAWATGVYSPLFGIALDDCEDNQLQEIHCTTARICKHLLPASASNSHMIDYCFAVNPSYVGPKKHPTKTAATLAAKQLWSKTDALSINHTDYEPLTKWPITFSVETKRPEATSPETVAKIQMSTWQYAQWILLEDFAKTRAALKFDDAIHTGGAEEGDSLPINQRIPDTNISPQTSSTPSVAPSTLPGSTGFAATKDTPGIPFDTLPFIPGIIIIGHQWQLTVASKESPDGMVFYSGFDLGSTESLERVYCIVWALRRLKRWALEDYWPWYKSNILGL
ncbi:hypothetical protein MCOR25_010920 [Pyricularia grisea]|nr:hypothetical protein MCOR25_010920 [Pyricularia grisea]